MKNFSKIILLVLLHILIFSLSLTAAWAYTYSGRKWSGTSANYYINSVFAASFRTAMQAADSAWDNAGSKFRFYYQGTTSRNPDVWASNYSANGYNDIGFANKGNTGKIAGTRISPLNGSTITESDVTFNTYYGFTTVGAAGMYDVQNTMTHEFGHWLKLDDLSSWTGPSWCEIWDWESTMCYFLPIEETQKRTLEDDDKDGIKAIYGT